MDDSNELAQANFMMLLCKYGEVSAPNLRTYFKVRSYASKVCITKEEYICFNYVLMKNKMMITLAVDIKQK